MTCDEFIPIAAEMQAHWWAFPIPASALDQYAADLADLPAENVAAAVAAHAAAGAERPPTAGQIRRRVAELELDAPSWDDARTALVAWRRGADRRRAAADAWECPRGECDGDLLVQVDERTARPCKCTAAYVRALRGLDELPALVGEFIGDGHATFSEICKFLDEENTTLEAQVRGRWREFIDRVISSRVLAALPEGSALRRLEAARQEDDSRRERHSEPRRLDMLSLVSGKAA